MERHIDQDLSTLKEKIASMGGFVEKAIDEVIQSFKKRNVSGLQRIREYEDEINVAHVSVDEACLSLLAKNSPLAKDLRLVMAVIKINADLERMGDQTVNITHCAKHLFTQPPLPTESRIANISSEVQVMVRECLDAFMKHDHQLAERVLKRDDSVDRWKNTIFSELVEIMKKEPEKVDVCLDLILIARNFERLADHATNVAEDVIFASTGRDVRHNGNRAHAKFSAN